MILTPDELLKFKLLADGVLITPQARDAWRERFEGPLTLAEYATTGGVALILEGGLYVNAPPMEKGELPLLGFEDDSFVVTDDGRDVRVDVVPVPSFHARTLVDRVDGTTRPYTNYGVTHTDRCRVSPIEGCAWKCKFCDLPYEFDYRKKHQDDLLAVIRAAEDDPQAPARHVLVSGGTPRARMPARAGRPASDDAAWIDDLYAYLAQRSPLPVDVMLAPRRDLSHPEKLRRAGVNMLSVNLEISEETRLRALAPAKAKLGRGHTLDYIERAVEAFEVGFVQSLVVFGSAIEPIDSTMRGIQDLVDRGCIPVLSPFRPHPLTPLAHAQPASLEEILTVYARTLEVCERADNVVQPGPRCIACHHNTVTIPNRTSFYSTLDDDLTARPCRIC